MISHQHKIIFIHIPKCAGSSIETAFGINVNDNKLDRENLFGWDEQNRLYLQHATPQELIDLKLISKKQWESYFKFIIIRNSWDKVMSDFFWFKTTKNFKGNLSDYLDAKNDFLRFMQKGDISYRGDHLTPQIDYMYLNSELIKYDKIILFDKDNLNSEFAELAEEINMKKNFFEKKVQVGKKNKIHYSTFYTNRMKKQVHNKYKEDIDFFNFKFEDKRRWYNFFNLKF